MRPRVAPPRATRRDAALEVRGDEPRTRAAGAKKVWQGIAIDERQYVATQNAKNLLRSLYASLQLVEKPDDGVQQTAAAVLATLKKM